MGSAVRAADEAMREENVMAYLYGCVCYVRTVSF